MKIGQEKLSKNTMLDKQKIKFQGLALSKMAFIEQ
jgi:hypothetical protein